MTMSALLVIIIIIQSLLLCLQGKLGERRLGVSPDKPNVPVFILIHGGSPTKQILFNIIEFENATPKQGAFEIPESCPKSSDTEAVHLLQLVSLTVPRVVSTSGCFQCLSTPLRT